MHFLEKQACARRRTALLFGLYLSTIIAVAYLSYSVMHSLLLLWNGSHPFPENIVLYLVLSPFDFLEAVDWFLLITITIVVLGIFSITAFFSMRQLRGGGRVIAQLLGGELLVSLYAGKPERRLLNVVEEIAIASGVHVPQVYVLKFEKGINAFSAGWDINDAVICVTQGLIDQLTRDEQQAVTAHEFSHIINGDTRLNFQLLGFIIGSHVLIFLSWGSLSAFFAMAMITILLSARVGLAVVVNSILEKYLKIEDVNFVFGILAGLAVIAFVQFCLSAFLKFAIARQREYFSDVMAVQWTRLPSALISVLQKINQSSFGSRITHSKASTISHMTFASVHRPYSRLLDTHPALISRIRAIESRPELWPELPSKKKQTEPTAKDNPESIDLNKWRDSEAANEPVIDISIVSETICSIPEPVNALAIDPDSVAMLIYSLLLHQHETVRRQQLAIIENLNDTATRSRTEEILPSTDPLAKQLKPLLAEITFPTLRQLSLEQYQRFRTTVNTLIRADGKIDLFEYMFSALLVRDLDLHFRVANEARVLYYSCRAVLDPFVLVLSCVAYAGNRGDGSLMQAYREGIEIFGIRKPIIPSKDCTFDQFDAALQKLAATTPSVKRRILRALTACIMADHIVTVKERETLRAITAMLGVPMPVLA